MTQLWRYGLLRFVGAIAFLFFFHFSNAQVQTARTNSINGNCGGYYEYLPQGYSSNSWQSYPLIVAVHGIGELGNGTSDLPNILNCWTSLTRRIANGGFPTSFSVGGQSFSFIVISPQFKSWPSSGDVNDVVNYAIQNYRVDQSRIYVTGLSMGGGAVWTFAGDYPTKAAAIVPVCGAWTADAGRAQAISNAKLAVWATHNQDDPTVGLYNTTGWVDMIKQYGGDIISTIFPVSGHDAWSRTYDPSFTQNGVNIYQWMLQHQKGGGSTPPPAAPNQAPSVSTTGDQTITLPQSSVTLSANASDPDGSIASYQWSQLSGPSQASIASASAASTTVNNLIQGSYAFRITVTDNKGATAVSDVVVKVNSPITVSVPSGSPSSSTSTSSRIEAENWSGVSAGPQTENTQDAGGGKDVGWISNGSWMDYSVTTSSAGSYTISFRVATPYTGSQLQVMSGGSVLTTVRVPFTGGFQNWQTVTATINLNAGTQTLRIQSTSNEGFNFNWFELSAGGSTSSTPPPSSSTSTSSRIEAENWSGVSAGPQTENTQDAGGGKDVGWISNGSWMDYSVTTSSAGSYTISFRVATPYTGSQLQVMSGGSVLTTVRVPFTGGFQNWQTVTATINLNAGTQTLRIQSTSNEGFNFNWFELSAGGSTSSTPPPSSSTSTSSRIEAENWSGVSAGPQTENTQDAGGGKDVGWISNGSWMDYSVTTSSAGSYTISFRVATPYTGSQLQVMSGGSVLTTVRVPFTGGFQNWQTVTATINLNAGTQTLRIQSTSNEGFNFNWFELSAGGSTSSTPPPSSSTSTSSRIEAENWSGVSAGPQTENTQDAGGGKDVGWISNGSWMDYSVTTSSAGSYTISFRVATPYTGSQLQVMSGGSVLTTVRVPFTGGFQNWQTVTATINLNAGTQTLRIQSTSNEGFNFNWFELSAGGSIVSARTVQTAEVSTVSPTTSTSMVVYPNPVTSAFQLRVDNELTGSMTVQVIDMQGRVQKQFALTKAATGTSQFYLSIGELPKATYVLKATMNDWNQSTQIIKQ